MGTMTYRVKDLPYDMQPRTQVRYRGIEKVQPEVLLAVLLRTGVHGRNVLEIAHDLLQRFGSLEALSIATWQSIVAKGIPGIGEVAAMVLAAAFELERRAVNGNRKSILKELHCASDVAELLFDSCQAVGQETFFVIPVDGRNKMLTEPIAMVKGRRHAVDFDMGQIFEAALKYSSDRIIVAHNHPSGDPSPSSIDLSQTRRMLEAAKVLDVEIVDHVIIGNGSTKWFSIAESGMIAF